MSWEILVTLCKQKQKSSEKKKTGIIEEKKGTQIGMSPFRNEQFMTLESI